MKLNSISIDRAGVRVSAASERMVSFAQFSGPEARRQASVAKIHSFMSTVPLHSGQTRKDRSRPSRPAVSVSRSKATVSTVPESLRIPARRENWAYLRSLREAELLAWNAMDARSGVRHDSATRSLRHEAAKALKDSPLEKTLTIGIGVLAIGTVVYSLTDSMSFVQNWSNFVQFVSQLLS
jgi:hypothetical protein